jgi:hypothetical protein
MALETGPPSGQTVEEDAEVDQSPWWDGRQVAIRPDVPSRGFDPDDLILVKTDNERLASQTRINRYVADQKNKPEGELWPRWLSEPPEAPSESMDAGDS